jgi:hypothetical protein
MHQLPTAASHHYILSHQANASMESRFDLVLHPILGDQSQVMVKVSPGSAANGFHNSRGETKLVVGVERAASLNANILSALQLIRCSVLCAVSHNE